MIALPEISHRGPLGPWKPLLRAIACFYRRDDQGCARNLAAIDPASSPARLIPALRGMLSGHSSEALSPAAAALVAQASGNLKLLQEALHDLDVRFVEGKKNAIVDGIRRAMSIARSESPEILNELRRHIGVRANRWDCPAALSVRLWAEGRRRTRTALLVARVAETDDDGEVDACFAWETFRSLALHEGWFPRRGPEIATVYLHMASIAGGISEKDIDEAYARVRGRYAGKILST